MENEKDLEGLEDFEEEDYEEEDEELEEDEEDLELEDEEEDEDEEDTEEESNDKPEEKKPEDSKEQTEEEKKKAQQKEQNRINAERRKREKEKREEALKKQGYNEALKEEIGGTNPYTHKKIEDDVDMDMYLKMRELAKQGKDPIADYADFIANEKRENLKLAQEKKAEETKAQNDINDFSQKYPDVDVSQLLKDERFSAFADGKLGAKSLADIYESFLKFESYYESKSEEEADKKAAKRFARLQSSMGSQTSPKNDNHKKSYKEMSDEEFEAELLKVKQGY